MKKIFVIVVAYNGKQWYDQCFTSLRQSSIPVTTIVVDNASTDGSAEYIREIYPEIVLIESKENLGFGRGNNLGMKYAMKHDCDYVFLLNQDAWLAEASSLERLIEIAEKYPEYAVYSPMHLSADKQHLNFLIDDGKRNYELLSDLYTDHVKELYRITYVNAAAWLLPRRTLENIGGFCPLIYHYGEDDDYMSRLRYHKERMGLVPSSCIVHDHRTRLDNSKELFIKSNIDEIESWLDLNGKTIKEWKTYYLREIVVGYLKHDKKRLRYYKYKYKLLMSLRKEIEKCREAHKIKQANWL